MKVLLTGAFGNVGRSTLNELILKGHEVTIFEVKNPRNLRYYRKCRKWVKAVWGDIRDPMAVSLAVRDQDVVIHLAAVIPPLADLKPELAKSVNVEGTRNIVRAIERQGGRTRLLYSSSVAVYGDRLAKPMIELNDEVKPNDTDGYAKQKVEAESIIRNSVIDWAIFRLSFIVPPASFRIDRVMFEMPLSTSIEVCDTLDVGRAFACAVERTDISGQTFHIAGGEKCRTNYGTYVNRIMELYGVGRDQLPVEAFSRRGYHCGFMNTDTSRDKFSFQKLTLEDHYLSIKRRARFIRFFARLIRPFRPFLVGWIVNHSPYYREWKKTHKKLSVGVGFSGADL